MSIKWPEWLPKHRYNSDLICSFPAFPTLVFNSKLCFFLQILFTLINNPLLGFSILRFAKVQRDRGWKRLFKALSTVDKNSGMPTALSKYFLHLLMPKQPQEHWHWHPTLSHAIMWTSCCPHSSSRTSGLNSVTLKAHHLLWFVVFGRLGFSYQTVVLQMHQHFNIPA